MTDAFAKAEKSFPKKIQALPLRGNLSLLSTYRDNAVHFYNEPGFGVLIYALAQTSIINFRDLLMETFGKNLADDISWRLMPLGLEPPTDPLTYISQDLKTNSSGSAVKQFISTLASNLKEVEDAGADAGRIMTIFNVSLQSIKKIENADLVVGIDGKKGGSGGPLVLTKIKDPNTAYPLRQKEILQKILILHGKPFTTHTFQSVCYKFGFKDDPVYCWKSVEGVLTKYSNEIIPRIKALTAQEVETSLNTYNKRFKK
jgi:hypothetical protein